MMSEPILNRNGQLFCTVTSPEICMPFYIEMVGDEEATNFLNAISKDILKTAEWIRNEKGIDNEYFNFLLTTLAKNWSHDKTGDFAINHIDEKIPREKRIEQTIKLKDLEEIFLKTDLHFVRQTIQIMGKTHESQWEDVTTVLAFLHGLETVAINRKIMEVNPYGGLRLCQRCCNYFYYNHKGRIPKYCNKCRYQSKLEGQRKSKNVEHLKYCEGCGKPLTGRQRVTCNNPSCRKRRERKKEKLSDGLS